MRARIGAGIAGWLVSVLPTAAVNAAAYVGILTYQEAALANAVAFFGGLLLGGAVAGALGGRGGYGLRGAAQAGGTTAALYAATVVVLIFGAASIKTTFLFADAPAAVVGAVAFLALLQLGAALLAGALVGRTPAQPATVARMPQSRPRPVSSDPRGYPQRPPSTPRPRGSYPSEPRTLGGVQSGQPGREADGVHAGRRSGAEWREPGERDPHGKGGRGW